MSNDASQALPDAAHSPVASALEEAVEAVLWQHAVDGVAKHPDAEPGAVEHVYYGLRSDYQKIARYRYHIDTIALGHLLLAAEARPANTPVQ